MLASFSNPSSSSIFNHQRNLQGLSSRSTCFLKKVSTKNNTIPTPLQCLVRERHVVCLSTFVSHLKMGTPGAQFLTPKNPIKNLDSHISVRYFAKLHNQVHTLILNSVIKAKKKVLQRFAFASSQGPLRAPMKAFRRVRCTEFSVNTLDHSIHIRILSCQGRFSALLNWFKLVFGLFEQNIKH